MSNFYIFGGCSFTDMPNSWARYICDNVVKKYWYLNVSKSGSGNSFIATAAMNAALKAAEQGYKPDISIMWSAPSRIEFPLRAVQTPYFNQLFDVNKNTNSDMNPGLYAIKNLQGEHEYDKNNWWIFNGGLVSHKTKWATKSSVNKEYVDAFEKLQMYFCNTNMYWHNTLMNILNVQNLCEANGWNYRFTTFRSYVNEYKQHCAPQFKYLQDAVKWDKFAFTDDADGGLREYTLNNLNTWDDGYDNHPSYEAHADFVNNFWLRQFPEVYK